MRLPLRRQGRTLANGQGLLRARLTRDARSLQASGDNVWLLDIVAPSQRMASAVLANFKQVVKQGEVRIHPMVARQVDPELLKKMGATVDGAAS